MQRSSTRNPEIKSQMPRAAREITLRFLAAPTDAGYSGNVSGGRVLEWIDKAGCACAVGWAGTYSVTAYVGNVRFSPPVTVGDLVEATAQLIYTGHSSVHILVIVRSGSVQDRLLTEATQCLMSSSPWAPTVVQVR
jgi:acyl-CoA hydrolase